MSQEVEILRRLSSGITLTPIYALAEKWVNLSGDNEGYQISNFGRVKSMERKEEYFSSKQIIEKSGQVLLAI